MLAIHQVRNSCWLSWQGKEYKTGCSTIFLYRLHDSSRHQLPPCVSVRGLKLLFSPQTWASNWGLAAQISRALPPAWGKQLRPRATTELCPQGPACPPCRSSTAELRAARSSFAWGRLLQPCQTSRRSSASSLLAALLSSYLGHGREAYSKDANERGKKCETYVMPENKNHTGTDLKHQAIRSLAASAFRAEP